MHVTISARLEVLLEKLIVAELGERFLVSWRTRRYITCSLDPAAGPDSETEAASPHPPALLF
jgi:hypothetical protein